MAKNSYKRKSPKKKTSNKHNQYYHVKTGQTVIFKNGACAKRQSNGQFRFVKRTSCKKSKRGGAPGDGGPDKVPISAYRDPLEKSRAIDDFLVEYDKTWDDIMTGSIGLEIEQMKLDGIRELVKFLPTNLSSLDLHHHGIGDEGVSVLTNLLNKMTGLNELHLKLNDIGNAGVMALAQNLPDGLQELSLSDNQIGDEGVMALAVNLPASLKVLRLGNNKIGNEGAKALARRMPSSLKVLDLNNNNKIDFYVGKALVKAFGGGGNMKLHLKKKGVKKIGETKIKWDKLVSKAKEKGLELTY